MTVPTPEALRLANVSEIARIVERDWAKVNFAARPYLDAMHSLHSDDARYGADSALTIVAYFVVNAGTWRGDTARVVKAELKRRFRL